MVMNADEAGPELTYLESMIKKSDCAEDLDEEKMEVVRARCNKRIITWMQKSYANITLDMRRKSEQKDLICILLDIILYKDSELVNMGFTLLTNYFSQK